MTRKRISITVLASAAAVIGFGLPANAQTGDANYPPSNYPPSTPTTVFVPDPVENLPTTGSDGNGTLVLIAASLLGVGGAMTLASRSRRPV